VEEGRYKRSAISTLSTASTIWLRSGYSVTLPFWSCSLEGYLISMSKPVERGTISNASSNVANESAEGENVMSLYYGGVCCQLSGTPWSGVWLSSVSSLTWLRLCLFFMSFLFSAKEGNTPLKSSLTACLALFCCSSTWRERKGTAPEASLLHEWLMKSI